MVLEGAPTSRADVIAAAAGIAVVAAAGAWTHRGSNDPAGDVGPYPAISRGADRVPTPASQDHSGISSTVTGRPFLIVGDSPQSLIGNLSPSAAKHSTSPIAKRPGSTRSGSISSARSTRAAATTDRRSTGSRRSRRAATWQRPIPRTSPRRRDRSAGPPRRGWWCSSIRSRPADGSDAPHERRREGLRLRTVPRAAASGLPEHRLVERKRLSDLAERTPTMRLVLAVAQRDPLGDPNAPADGRARLSGQRLTRRRRWRPVVSARRRVHVPPDVRHGSFASTTASRRSGLHGRGGYEFEQDTPSTSAGDPQVLRRQEYWTALSGAAGQFYGNHFTLAVPLRLGNHLHTIGKRRARLFDETAALAHVVPTRSGRRPPRGRRRLRHLDDERQRRFERLRDGSRDR